MKKYLFYAMQGEKLCFVHVLLNALDLHQAGHEVRIVFEGKAVTLPPVLSQENHPLYKKAIDEKLIAGVCLACSKNLGVHDEIVKLGLPLLSDMSGHAGLLPFTSEGYEVFVF